jgi:iron complex transport system substrate-binding protein
MRIVSLISSGTEILFALGLGEQVAAVSHECDFPPAARRLPRATRCWIDSSRPSDDIDRQVRERLAAGQPLYDTDDELLCRLAPDLIVTQAQCDVCAVRFASVLELVQSRPELRDTRVIPLNPQSIEDVLADVGRLAQVANAETAGEQLRGQLQSRIDIVTQGTVQLATSERPRVVCIEWVAPLMTAGNWTPQLIDWAGGQCGLAKMGQPSEYITSVELQAYDPEVLLVAPCGFDLARSMREAKVLPEMPGWSDLTAVKAERTFVIDGNAYLNRSGPRLVESLEILAHLIHPNRFPPPPIADAWRPLL